MEPITTWNTSLTFSIVRTWNRGGGYPMVYSTLRGLPHQHEKSITNLHQRCVNSWSRTFLEILRNTSNHFLWEFSACKWSSRHVNELQCQVYSLFTVFSIHISTQTPNFQTEAGLIKVCFLWQIKFRARLFLVFSF